MIQSHASRLLGKIVGTIRLHTQSRGVTYDPYNKQNLEPLADKLFEGRKHLGASGSIERGRIILQTIEGTFPTEKLTKAYFENLELLLKNKRRRSSPGQLLIGLGTGRSGSTTFSNILSTVSDSCCTHENPPIIFWRPEPEQIDFHVRRFRILVEYFSLVMDTSHWWLNSVQRIAEQFATTKFVGLIRDTEACAKSFMRIKGSGFGSYNHWAPHRSGIWCSAHWDPTYPTYEMPVNSRSEPDGAKHALIVRYIREYNERLIALAQALPNNMRLVNTEDLNKAATQERLFHFVDSVGYPILSNLNVGAMTDGRDSKFIY